MSDSVVLADPHKSGSFIITESNFSRARSRVTIPAGTGALGYGTVLGQVTIGGKYVPSPDIGSDGSQIACAILWEDIDASGDVDVQAGVIARDADVFGGALSYDISVNNADKIAAKAEQLALSGIVVLATDDPEARAANANRMSLGW